MVDMVTRMTCLNKDSVEDVNHGQGLSRCHARPMREREFSLSMRVDNSDDDSIDTFAVVTKYNLFTILTGLFWILIDF